MAVVGGSLYYNKAATWTEIDTTQTAGQDVICDFAMHNNYLFVCDYANNSNRVWNGVEAGTATQSLMNHGYQNSFTIGESAAGGGLSDTTGTGYKVMSVTKLESGGYRATESARQTITGGGSSNEINLTSITMDAVHTEFHFDIDSTATTWFMTEDGGDLYYKIPAANYSEAANPAANTVSSIDITSVANLTSANTLAEEYTRTQEYFTGQVAAPQTKFFATGQGALFCAGDPNNKSRVWIPSLNEPQVFGDGTSSGAGS
jgi:hypothetical protein